VWGQTSYALSRVGRVIAAQEVTYKQELSELAPPSRVKSGARMESSSAAWLGGGSRMDGGPPSVVMSSMDIVK
jgi:hypothetical protein